MSCIPAFQQEELGYNMINLLINPAQ